MLILGVFNPLLKIPQLYGNWVFIADVKLSRLGIFRKFSSLSKEFFYSSLFMLFLEQLLGESLRQTKLSLSESSSSGLFFKKVLSSLWLSNRCTIGELLEWWDEIDNLFYYTVICYSLTSLTYSLSKMELSSFDFSFLEEFPLLNSFLDIFKVSFIYFIRVIVIWIWE